MLKKKGAADKNAGRKLTTQTLEIHTSFCSHDCIISHRTEQKQAVGSISHQLFVLVLES